MRLVAGTFAFLCAFVGLNATAFAKPVPVCSGSTLRDAAVYVATGLGKARCWKLLTHVGGEGFRTSLPNAVVVPFVETAQFIYVQLLNTAQYPDDSPRLEAAVVVKERVFAIAPSQGGVIAAEESASPAEAVLLERPAITTRCASLGPLLAGEEELGRYNNFHRDPTAPISGDLIKFHFRYPANKGSCRETQDAKLGNREAYAIERLGGTVAPRGLLALFQFGGSAQASENKYDVKIQVRNLAWRGRANDNLARTIATNMAGRALEFSTENIEGSRLELTIVDLENRVSLRGHRPTTWQLQWGE